MKRTKDVGLLPDYLQNDRYRKAHIKYSGRRLSLEIHERQFLYSQIKDFEFFYRHPEKDHKRFYPGIQLTLLHDQHKKALPVGRADLTIEEYIEIDRKFYFQKLEAMTDRLITLNKSKQPLEHLEKLLSDKNTWDSRPYIRPITNTDPTLQKHFDLSFNEFRAQLTQIKNQELISLNLDFSDDVIIEELRAHLKFLRKRKEYKKKFMRPKLFISKLKQYRILQVMDICLWQMLSNCRIEYSALTRFLYPKGEFSNEKLRKTIITQAENLLDRKSEDSQYLFYIADKEFRQKIA